jgi:glyoxylase-like metal-dependent hydrolase (beta-lactamase superfamily II)
MQILDLGTIAIRWLGGGEFELDGGTMYGAVPKILWQERYPADGENFIKMRNAPLLVRTGTANILIDTGLGNKLSAKQQAIYRVYRPWSLPEDLRKIGLRREDVSHVVLTHGDFDHAGGVVMLNGQGSLELTFPRADHFIQEKEWHDITHPNIRSAHSYWPDNFRGLPEAGRLRIIDGDAEISPGIYLRLTGGHTRGHQMVEMQGSAGCAVHLGDVLPTHTHANPLWIMAYDNFPLELIERKKDLIPCYRQRNCWFTFYHDIFMKACRLDERGKAIEHIP